jgi:hypothetical protein
VAQSPDPLANPYAPPKADVGPPRGTRRSKYEAERRSVLLLVLLCVISFGLYPLVWYVRRARFLDSLDSDKKMEGLHWAAVAVTALSFSMSILIGALHVHDGMLVEVHRPIQLAVGVAVLLVSFRVAGILRSDFARTGRLIGTSGVAVFFFGCLYLQHVINKAADTPATRKKRK